MYKIKRLIVTLIFPKTVASAFAGFVILITLTSLKVIPAVLGWTLSLLFFIFLSVFLLMIIYTPVRVLHVFIWIFNHTVYKIKTIGHENIPLTGGALLVSNSVSYIDNAILFSAINRPVKFFVSKEFREHPFLKPFLTPANSIPIDENDNPKAIARALQKARKAIVNGELVCIFSEGNLTHTGNMLPFRRGFEFIMRGLTAPIIPMHIDRIWGSTFSFADGKLTLRFPKVVPYPITVSIGKPMPSSSKAFQVRLAVQELSAEAFKYRGKSHRKLHVGFVYEMKRSPFRMCVSDLNVKLNFLQTFALSAALSETVGKKNAPGEMVGIILPTSIASAVANIAILFAGKIPVNLNFTSSVDTLKRCMEECAMEHVVTSRSFLDKINLHAFDGSGILSYIEDMKSGISFFKKIRIMLAGLLLPAGLLAKKYAGEDASDVNGVATVMFSSGSTGEPKGIMLTHLNIASNVESTFKILGLNEKDVIAAVLPLFHSFGYTATFWMAVYYGIGVAFHSSPREAQKIGELVQKRKCTVIFGTPTFLNFYVNKCSAEQFAPLRIIIAGAEKLRSSVSKAFYEKFQKTVFEGYGATELSPVVSLGTQCYIDPRTKKRQFGNKFGTVGHPIPGVAAKVVNPETFELLPFGKEGMLLVKGPNVMKGYLNQPEKTASVIKDGWYVTGDISIIDEDGFIAITDRINRFSKIAGEMVPLVRIEEEIQAVVREEERFCFVVAVPDDKKGERLTVLYKGERNVDDILEGLYRKGLPKLWVPKRENFYKVDEFPVLGTGKTDFKALKALAQEMFEKSAR
ncbi:MAG: AMP-binding protein [Endomicrobium sp.]|nr:AMP-binding protein [Endomicrobium sp.]